MTYKTNSVIYFEGDSSNRIYVLKSGRVTLTSNDIETGQELKDRVEQGEFFGVRSALGRYPHEENAVVVATAQVIVFSVPEFEQFAASNTRVILKMLKVFSTQLRRIHSKVTNMLDQPGQLNPEHGLFQIGEYFHKQKRTRQAYYAFDRYLTLYPNGPRAEKARKLRDGIETRDARYTSAPAEPAAKREEPERVISRLYYKAVSDFGQDRFAEALEKFREVASSGDEEFQLPSMVEAGRCLLRLEKVDDSIRHFTSLVQKHPKMKDLPRVLYYLGRAYEEKGERERAGSFFKKVQSLAPGDDELQKQVKYAMQNL